MKVYHSSYHIVNEHYIRHASLWQVINDLHIKNHADKKCVDKTTLLKVRQSNPLFNLMTAEQTFAWLSRYKRILCSMDKLHHQFFLHSLVHRRNKYTERCIAKGRKILLPKNVFKHHELALYAAMHGIIKCD